MSTTGEETPPWSGWPAV